MKWKRNTGFDQIEDRRGQAVGGGGGGANLGGLLVPLLGTLLSGKAGKGGIVADHRDRRGRAVQRHARGRRQSRSAGWRWRRRARRHAGAAKRHRPAAVLHRRQHPGLLGEDVRRVEPGLPGDGAGAVRGRNRLAVRPGLVGDRPVLLSGRPEGVPRPRLLRRAQGPLRGAGWRLRDGVRRRPRVRPPHPDRPRHLRPGPADVAAGPVAAEPAVGPPGAAGRLLRRRLGKCRRRPTSRPATSPRRSTPPRRSATTGSRRRRAAGSTRKGWTHGSAEQRVAWFTKGHDTGNPEECDTFAS